MDGLTLYFLIFFFFQILAFVSSTAIQKTDFYRKQVSTSFKVLKEEAKKKQLDNY